MCLFNKPDAVKAIRKKHRGSFIAYKVLKRTTTGLVSPIYTKCWRPGLSKSNSRRKKCCQRYDVIDNGIHVLWARPTRKQSLSITRLSPAVVPVRVHIKDLLGANVREGVFRQVYLEEKDYKRALARTKPPVLLALR